MGGRYDGGNQEHRIAVILATIAITLLLALVLVNLAGAEHKVQKQIDHLYKVDDEQFTRAMGLMR